jgi:hypothetical protein
MQEVLNLVFSNYKYSLLALSIFTMMLFGLLIISEYLFLEPYVIGYIAPGSEVGFVLIVILSTLTAFVIPLNIYQINILKTSKRKMSSSLFGSIVGSISGACSCGPIGFTIATSFGALGVTTTTFLTNFELPLRIGAIGLLIFTCYITIRSLKRECSVIQ